MRVLWCAVLGLALAVPGAAQEKWALLIGINDYIHGPERWDLRGCENDVKMTSELLVSRFGFPRQNIKTLLSAEATRQAIVDGIEDWLVANSKPEDIVYFHFSGHGSQLTDVDGDEDDGKDEMICPADMRKGDRGSIITDDELRELFAGIPAQNVTIVLDACHSGSGTRDLSLVQPRFAEFEDRAVVVSASPRPVTSTATSSALPAPAVGGGMESGKLQVTISGCRPDETSADAYIKDGFYAGALTYNLTHNLKTAPPEMTYRQLMDRVVRDVKAKYTQSPQIEGDVDRPIFGTPVAGASAKPFALLESVAGDRVRLNVGSGQGATAGSVWKVFGPEETRFEGDGLGRVQLVEVADNASEAAILEGAPLVAGQRAVEVLHRVEGDRLTLLLEAPDGVKKVLARALERYDFVHLARPGQFFDRRLIVVSKGGKLEARLTLDGRGGTPVYGATASILAAELEPQLENAFAIKFLAGFDNPAPGFKVEVWANRVAAGDEDQLADAPDQRLIEARLGDVIRFNFRSEVDCYLTLINVGTSGRVTVLFPNQYRPDGFIAAGKTYRTGTKGEMPFKIRARGPAGRELVKVIATLQPLDLASLKMGKAGGAGTRSIDSGSRFAQQLTRDLAIEGLAEEDSGDLTLLPTANWATDYLIVETSP